LTLTKPKRFETGFSVYLFISRRGPENIKLLFFQQVIEEDNSVLTDIFRFNQ